MVDIVGSGGGRGGVRELGMGAAGGVLRWLYDPRAALGRSLVLC